MKYKWGAKEWFEYMFDYYEDCDRWGHRWRGSQKFRYDLYIKILEKNLPKNEKIKILDIGCALGDFTRRVWQLNPKNEIFGIDISKNAITRVSKMYPDMEFAVAALPNLPFKENSFDLILCLEVLYYLSPDDRIRSLENIKKTLKSDGYLLFSGVLNGGVRYFAEDEIIELISKYFEIKYIEYNYARIYTAIESKFLSMLNIFDIIKMVLNMEDKDFLKWCEERKNNRKIGIVKKARRITITIPFGRNIVRGICIFISSIIRWMLSWKVPVIISYKITQLILREKGKTQIIILARNSKNGDVCV